jgi:hypothetical protein
MTVKYKYKMAWALVKELASALSRLNDEEFDEQFSMILEIKTLIENRMKFKLSFKDPEEKLASTRTLDSNTCVTGAVNNSQTIIATESVILSTTDAANNVKSVDMSNNNFLKVSTIGAMFRFNASVLLSPALSILKKPKRNTKTTKTTATTSKGADSSSDITTRTRNYLKTKETKKTKNGATPKQTKTNKNSTSSSTLTTKTSLATRQSTRKIKIN